MEKLKGRKTKVNRMFMERWEKSKDLPLFSALEIQLWTLKPKHTFLGRIIRWIWFREKQKSAPFLTMKKRKSIICYQETSKTCKVSDISSIISSLKMSRTGGGGSFIGHKLVSWNVFFSCYRFLEVMVAEISSKTLLSRPLRSYLDLFSPLDCIEAR